MVEEKNKSKIFIINCAGEEEPVYLVCSQEFLDRYYDPETGDLFPVIESIEQDQDLTKQLQHDMEAIRLYDAMKPNQGAAPPQIPSGGWLGAPPSACWGPMPSAVVSPSIAIAGCSFPVVHNITDDIVFPIVDKVDPVSYYQLPYPKIEINATNIPDKIEIKFPPKHFWRATCREKVEATDKCGGYWKTFRVYMIADSMRAALDRLAFFDCTHIERVDMDDDHVLM